MKWLENNVVVGRFPLPQEIKNSNYDVLINVSDENIIYCSETAFKNNKQYYWFPLSEGLRDIGINSIYGSLQILHLCEINNLKVYLHCHAGANRSQTVYDCYHYMMYKEHLNHIETLDYFKRCMDCEDDFNSFLHNNISKSKSKTNMNMLVYNCYYNHLPKLDKMEEFLNGCYEIFVNKEETMRGGWLSRLKMKLYDQYTQ